MTVASHGTLRQRRERIAAVRASGVVLVALDLFQLNREADIPAACDGLTLSDLLRLALVDYRARYTDTRREHLVRRDIDNNRRDGHNNPYRTVRCLFCTRLLAIRATTRESYRIAQLMVSDADDDDRDISPRARGGCFDVRLADDINRQLWCVADVADAIRPHVVVCALTSLAAMQVPLRPNAVKREPAELPLFGEGG